MRVKGSTIQQLEKDKPRSRCRKWRLWATTDEGRKSRRFTGTDPINKFKSLWVVSADDDRITCLSYNCTIAVKIGFF